MCEYILCTKLAFFVSVVGKATKIVRFFMYSLVHVPVGMHKSTSAILVVQNIIFARYPDISYSSRETLKKHLHS